MADPAGLEWLTIDDFSPGIYTAPGARSAWSIGTAGNFPARNVFPMGSATSDTYGCLPGPAGKGLIPGFYKDLQDNTLGFVVANLADANAAAPYIVAGHTIGSFGSGISQHVYAILYRAATTNFMTLKMLAGLVTGGPLMRTITAAVTNTQYTGITFAWSRMATAAPYTLAGIPVLAYGYGANYGSMGEAGVFPDPTAPTVTGVATFTDKGMVLAHQNRVVLLVSDAFAAFYGFGAFNNLSTSTERIDFTDPANSNVMGTQREVFYPEQSSGYGAWASLSASALFMVKRVGGAILLEGDIAGPRASMLPGVQPTGNIISKTAVTPIGVVYCSHDNGVWAWQGGSSSVKISNQLDDFFYRLQQTDTIQYFDANGYSPDGPSFQATYYSDYIFITGGWIYHIPTKSWWRLDNVNTNTNQQLWYDVDINVQKTSGGNVFMMPTLFAFHPKANFVSGTTYRTGYKYFLGQYASTWNWRCQPIRVGPPNVDINMRELVVVASRDGSATGTSRLTITLYDYDGSATVQTIGPFTISGATKPYRFPLVVPGNFLEMSVLAENTTDGLPAPMISEIRIGYEAGNIQAAL